ncbi:hypothetical protein CH275_01465 [Rhodococcus sp. 06-235-1A]|uniref:hypothetical protein n=1 Tax=Rhodococcus sp. 06-235-1A TaxID=2022508 RepID=UPI000B9BC0ED|nr:hypothetical protein [Rhodococcus sp. 06-235-1A]OZD10369.1 hypothetical protein CH275_01465 [Rhodococcus sp. 06-235-1A]
MTAAASRPVDVDGSDDPRPEVEVTDVWHIHLGAGTRFDRVVRGSIRSSTSGSGLKEFDSFVRRFAPSSYDGARIRAVIATHLAGASPIAYRAAATPNAGILVGASYRTTIDEVLGAVWEGCLSAVVVDAARAGVTDPVHLVCEHPTADSAALVLTHGVAARTGFATSMRTAIDGLHQVVSDV